MTGRGQPARGGRAHIADFVLDSHRRGRGRPRKFPLSTPLQLPAEEESAANEEEFRGGDESVYFDGDDDDRLDMEKIKQIQQQKMMIVTPMAQKRTRGRPPRQPSNLREEECEEEEELVEEQLIEEHIESGPLEGPSVSKQAPPMLISRNSSRPPQPQIPRPIIPTPVPVPVPKRRNDLIEPLIPNDAHIEDAEKEKEAEPEAKGPPPPPRHLANRANSRGRPANVIPPHRRPIPKDIVPPGSVKRALPVVKEVSAVVVKKPREEPEPAPVAPVLIDVKLEAPEAVTEVVISDSSEVAVPQESVKKREAGKDLPSEHFPKEKARHVSTRGLVPYDTAKEPMMAYDMHEMHEEEEGAQERVLTLQGGSFIEDRIGRADLMEDEEMKMMKSLQQQQYIQVEEDGVNVMYEVDPNDVIEETSGADDYVIQQRHQMPKQMVDVVDDDDDDDLPPQLVAEGVPEEEEEEVDESRRPQEKEIPLDEDGNFDLNMMEEGEMIRLQSPGGRAHEVRLARDVHGNSVFIDENGHIVELVTDTGALVEPNNMVEQESQEMVEQGGEDKKKQQQQNAGEGPSGQIGHMQTDRGNLEFSFLDNNNICCGLCGEIVLYEKLVSEHLPAAHPEYLSPGVELEEVPYDNWLKTRLKQEMKSMQNGFRHYDEHEGAGFGGAVRLYSKGLRQLRKVSQIRVNVNEMTMSQLEVALKRKLIEKMGRKVPVSLVDRLHARCDICQAVVSLNKKFEVVHLVRHFNAWHPAEHRCSQEWKEAQAATSNTQRRPLSLHDFAIVGNETDHNNLQCIWCGMFMDRSAVGMHFTEVHAQQVIVPNCSLCLQEMVMTARLMEKYGEDFGISLPDEFHLHSSKLEAKFSSEKGLDKAIDRHLKRLKAGSENQEEEENQEDAEAICTTNSQQSFGRRNRLKRKFVKPCFRQICPTNSQFFEAMSACEWKCRLCNRNVYGAVISAGAIKHYKEFHPSEIDNMQYELVKARLERIGDGSMEFVHPQLVECLICSLTYALHKPFNICRAIRHLRLKHPEVMPETAGKPISGAEIAETTDLQKAVVKSEIRFGEMITDPIELERFRKDNFDQHFDKVQVMYGIKKNNEPAYILLMEDEKVDMKTAQDMAEKVEREEAAGGGERFGDVEDQEEREDEQEFEVESKNQMVLQFPEQLVDEEVDESDGPRVLEEEVEEEDVEEQQFMPTYDANNPDHVLIEENEIMNDGNYEMIQEGDYQDMEEDNRTVRYLTEEEIQEAQARGELLEFAEEYVEEYGEQQ